MAMITTPCPLLKKEGVKFNRLLIALFILKRLLEKLLFDTRTLEPPVRFTMKY